MDHPYDVRYRSAHHHEQVRHMDRYYYDIDPSNRRYGEEELRQVREGCLLEPAEARTAARSAGKGASARLGRRCCRC